jgi:deoxyribonuclease-4
MGDTFEELTKLRDGVEQKERVGYVLDTQHTFSSGYDWRTDLEVIVTKIESTLGLENVKCFHLNDSLVDFGSHKDRHANLGEGKIGLDAITALVNHPKLKSIPFILETPNVKDDAGIAEEMNKLSSIMHE